MSTNTKKEMGMFGKTRALLLIWGILLAVSLLGVTIGLRQMSESSVLEVTLPIQPEAGEDEPPTTTVEVDGPQTPWTLALSVFTAVIAAAGFVGTTFFALRTDRRQTELHDLQVANLRTEIQRQQLEIERLRREDSPPPETTP
jgi:hypothetical protein